MRLIPQQAARPEIRDASLSDAKAIADFHVRIWRETYRDVAPPEAIQVLDEAHRFRSWQKILSDEASSQRTCLARIDDELVGFISFGPSSNPVFGNLAEIKHLYVDRCWRGQGIGQTLMTTAFRELEQQGFKGTGLAVVQDNQRARDFYKKFGGTETGSFTDPGPMWKSNNVLASWCF